MPFCYSIKTLFHSVIPMATNDVSAILTPAILNLVKAAQDVVDGVEYTGAPSMGFDDALVALETALIPITEQMSLLTSFALHAGIAQQGLMQNTSKGLGAVGQLVLITEGTDEPIHRINPESELYGYDLSHIPPDQLAAIARIEAISGIPLLYTDELADGTMTPYEVFAQNIKWLDEMVVEVSNIPFPHTGEPE